MSFELFDAPLLTASVVLPLELQQAALAIPVVLTKGGEPKPVTILVEVEVNAGA